MIPDLLLAFASVAVLLSPLLLEVGLNYELRRNMDEQDESWNGKLPL